MTELAAVVAIGLVALGLYGLFGGADFGGGVWDLLASGPRRTAQRETITHAIGPVWEANHVWLIFTIVLLFTCFPAAYAEIATRLNAPLTLALIGIVLRGAAFVFRNYAVEVPALERTWTVIFGAASLLAPFFLGDSAGALATGRFLWTSPFALATGAFAVALVAQVAAVFLLHETGDPLIRDDFRRRAIAATLGVWVVGLIPVGLSRVEAPALFAALLRPPALWAGIAAIVLGAGVMFAVARERDQLARVLVAGELLAVLGGWYGAQAPMLIPGRLTYAEAASPDATLAAFLIAVAGGAVVLIPSLAFLFAVFKRGSPRRSG